MASIQIPKAQSAAEIGGEITLLFDQLSQAPYSTSMSTQAATAVQQQAQRFGLWAKNMGLHRRDHAALDYRLRDASTVAAFTVDLLNSLKSALNSGAVREEAINNEYGYPEDDELVDLSEDELEDLRSFDEVGIIDAALTNADQALKRLFRLAFKIRNPRLRLRLTKAEAYEQVDPDTGVDLMQEFVSYDRNHVAEILKVAPRLENSLFDEAAEKVLIERLAKANTLRRKQFKHWKRHKLKLERHKTSVPATVPAKLETDGQTLPDIAEARSLPSQSQPTISNPTTATRLEPKNIDLNDDQSTVFSTFSSSTFEQSGDRVDLEIPRPPAHPDFGSEFECPYCFILCSTKVLRPTLWRDHIFRDLRPYVCTYTDCRESDQLYDSFQEWKNHESIHYDNSERRDRSCPICHLQGASDAHIASEMQRIALFALPRTVEDNEDSAYGSTDSRRAVNRSSDNSMLSLSLPSNSSRPARISVGSSGNLRPEDAVDERAEQAEAASRRSPRPSFNSQDAYLPDNEAINLAPDRLTEWRSANSIPARESTPWESSTGIVQAAADHVYGDANDSAQLEEDVVIPTEEELEAFQVRRHSQSSGFSQISRYNDSLRPEDAIDERIDSRSEPFPPSGSASNAEGNESRNRGDSPRRNMLSRLATRGTRRMSSTE